MRMKAGIRKADFKTSYSAGITSKWDRQSRHTLDSMYGKQGMEYLRSLKGDKNPTHIPKHHL